MNRIVEIHKAYFDDAEKNCLPHLSIDTVIFGFNEAQLKVLLQRFYNTNYYVLPGGYIGKEENMHDAAIRILKERTSLDNIFLEQCQAFGSVGRLNLDVLNKVTTDLNLPVNKWFTQRNISICYYSLVEFTKVQPGVIPPLHFESQWFDVFDLPDILFDHKEMVQTALQTLRSDLDEKLVAFKLMNETFTMIELQKLYEAVLHKKLQRANFQRKILSLDILERLEKQYNGKAHKAPFLYKFKERS
jgi:8-oxo-dGTP diphosphatase